MERLHAQKKAIVTRVAARPPERRGFIETSGVAGYAVPIRHTSITSISRHLRP